MHFFFERTNVYKGDVFSIGSLNQIDWMIELLTIHYIFNLLRQFLNGFHLAGITHGDFILKICLLEVPGIMDCVA